MNLYDFISSVELKIIKYFQLNVCGCIGVWWICKHFIVLCHWNGEQRP